MNKLANFMTKDEIKTAADYCVLRALLTATEKARKPIQAELVERLDSGKLNEQQQTTRSALTPRQFITLTSDDHVLGVRYQTTRRFNVDEARSLFPELVYFKSVPESLAVILKDFEPADIFTSKKLVLPETWSFVPSRKKASLEQLSRYMEAVTGFKTATEAVDQYLDFFADIIIKGGAWKTVSENLKLLLKRADLEAIAGDVVVVKEWFSKRERITTKLDDYKLYSFISAKKVLQNNIPMLKAVVDTPRTIQAFKDARKTLPGYSETRALVILGSGSLLKIDRKLVRMEIGMNCKAEAEAELLERLAQTEVV